MIEPSVHYVRHLKEEVVKKLVVIDGNSILNRAFYGIMGSKMLMTQDRNLYKCSLWFFSNYVQDARR